MTALFLAVLVTVLGLRLWLAARQAASARAHRDAVPEAFREQVPLDAHQKAADYTVAKARLSQVGAIWRAVLLLAFTLGGGLEWLDRLWPAGSLLGATGWVLLASVLSELCLLPLVLVRTFGIETRFGFNKMTPRLFVADLLKQALVGLLLGGPLVLGALALIRHGGTYWWILLWAGWLATSFFLAWAYPTWIAPLFNKFQPLTDERLRARIESLLQRTGFASEGIFVMDGSRRSTHANAYFTGFGRRKRIVFYDTLCTMLTPVELEAVLAHELGHFKLRHIWTRLAATAVLALGALGLFALLLERPPLFQALGVSHPSAHVGLVLLLWLGPLFAFPLRPLSSAWSRRQEYEADAFAAKHGDAPAMVSALLKLYEHNASTLTPDPMHSSFFDSHPPAPLRIARLLE